MNNKRDGRKLQIEIVLYVKFPTWESDAHDPTKKKNPSLWDFHLNCSGGAKDLFIFLRNNYNMLLTSQLE